MKKATKISIYLHQNLLRAIELSELHKCVMNDRNISDKFGNSFESYGYNSITYSIHFELVLIICRLVDKGNKQTASIPRLLDKLEQKKLLDEVLFFWMDGGMSFKSENETLSDVLEWAAEARDKTEIFRNSDLYTALKKIRNRLFAHSDVRGQGSSDVLKWGDAEVAVQQIGSIVKTLVLVIEAKDCDYESYRNHAEKRAIAFWRFASQASIGKVNANEFEKL